jgi:hypothetical protein
MRRLLHLPSNFLEKLIIDFEFLSIQAIARHLGFVDRLLKVR